MVTIPTVSYQGNGTAQKNDLKADLTAYLAAPAHTYFNFKRYGSDPVAFAHEVVGIQLTPYQAEILSLLATHKRVAVRSPHSAGKTTLAAIAVLWFGATHQPCKIPTTASVWRQLTEYLWPEITRWYRRANWRKLGLRPIPHKRSLDFGPDSRAFALASSDEAKIEGAHELNVLYVFDEAKAIPANIWDAAEGALASGNAYALAISTPGEATGRFYDIHARRPGCENWVAVHITLEEAVKAGRINPEWAANCARLWGESSAIYQNRVLGNFAEASPDQLIPLSWIEAAQERWHERNGQGEGQLILGVDVAFSRDLSAVAWLRGNVLERIDTYSGQDTMQLVGHLIAPLKAGATVAVDVIGPGAGVVHRLRELGYNPIAVNVAESTLLTDRSGELHFKNLRAAIWWGLRERLDPSANSPLALPPDDALVGDLIAPRFQLASSGHIMIEEKERIRARLGRSPDRGDALTLALAATVMRPPSFFAVSTLPPRRSIQARTQPYSGSGGTSWGGGGRDPRYDT